MFKRRTDLGISSFLRCRSCIVWFFYPLVAFPYVGNKQHFESFSNFRGPMA
jgi:hypothetical protein